MTSTKTETAKDGTIRLAAALATPEDTYRAAAALAKTVFPREPADDAVRRLHGLSHTEVLQLADRITPYVPAFASDRERLAFELGQERKMDAE